MPKARTYYRGRSLAFLSDAPFRSPPDPRRKPPPNLRPPPNPFRERLVKFRAPRNRLDPPHVSLDMLLHPVRERLTPGLQAPHPIRALLVKFRAEANLFRQGLLNLDAVRDLLEE